MAEIKKTPKHLELFPLDIENFVKLNELKQISDPVFFSRSNAPTPNGLLSNEIFGISREDRTSIYAYIDLGEEFIHPLGYTTWCKLDSNVKLCVYEQDTFKLDEKTGKLVQDDEGETGLPFLKKVLKKIKFDKNESKKREVRIDFLEKFRDKLFMKKLAVIPAGYRDVNTTSGDRVGVGEVNKLYDAVIRDSRALKESDEYGLTLNGNLRGRIQDNILGIYEWFVFGRFNGEESQASGLSRKLGLIRRAGMKKSFDWGARLVICTQDLRKESLEDLEIDLDSIGLPLAAICANFFPYMLYHIRNWFDRQFSDVTKIMVVNKKEKKTEYVTVEDWQSIFNDERIKKELDRFMHGMSNRFVPVKVPLKDGKEHELMFKGFVVPEEKIADEIKEGKTDITKFPINERSLTWCDIIYMAAYEICKDKMTLISRFPIDSYWNQFPAKIRIISTIETEPMIVNNTYYKHYPKIRQTDMNKNSSNRFVDVALPNNVRLGSIGGDYDGDTISSKAVYSIESTEELKGLINSKKHYISLGAENEMTTTNEGLQSLYSLTMVLDADKSKLTDPIF
nr:MAG TPA: DNA-directed RNA polymerase II subunit [Caudoviricetes sp.]